jgi:hypothetical protein
MKRLAIVINLIILIHSQGLAQAYIEPGLGLVRDLNNKNGNYVSPQLQFAFKMGKFYTMLVQVQKSWQLGQNKTADSAFTTNMALPLFSPAQKSLNTSYGAICIGNRFKVAGFHSNSSYYISLYTGIGLQKTTVKYSYDKANYTVLNPDETSDYIGLNLGMGLGYMHAFKKNRLLVELKITSPPIGDKKNYPNSYNLVAPLSLNVYYSIKL